MPRRLLLSACFLSSSVAKLHHVPDQEPAFPGPVLPPTIGRPVTQNPDERTPSFPLPRHLTQQGRDQFTAEIWDFVNGLSSHLGSGPAGQAADQQPEYTAAHVRAATE